jgi:hypothetical protein
LQILVLGFGLLQDGNAGVGVFPEGEEIFVGGERPGSAGADRISIRCISDESLPHYRKRRDGCMIASALEVKKEIPARDRGISVVMQSSSNCQEQT